MQTIYWEIIHTPWGKSFVAATDKAIVRLTLPGKSERKEFGPLKKDRSVELVRKQTPLIEQAGRQIIEYFTGKRQAFDLPLDLRGTDFQKKVWRTLLRIPYGKQWSYHDVAKAIGKPKATRAVGLANNANPIPIVVPCHRVIGKDGSLVGYGGGLPLKTRLLALESGSTS
ncbi:MAG TPA: methylated-DNA--[protein]-cysteine S-methyltransferase [Bdellovibrionota bacterium]|nr:methylated-DNA--[protein]-cysteine S-methyltransferase [Bdellovibrionota bacterium]